MKARQKLVKIGIVSLILLTVAVGNLRAAGDALLNTLPGDCTFCVRINDLSGSMAKIDQYLVGVAPIGTAMMVNMQLAGIVGDPMLNGIDMNGTFVAVGLPDFTVGVLVPVTSYADFVKKNANCTPIEDGVTLLSSPNSMMGAFALAGTANDKYAIVVPEAQKASLAALKAALSNKTSTLAKRLSATQSAESASAPVWAYVNLAALYNQFSPMVIGALGNAEANMPSEMGPEVKEIFAIYMEAFKELAGSADSATLAITPDPASLSIDLSLRAKDGSELAQMLVADPKAPKGFAFTGYMDNSNAVNGIMKVNKKSLGLMYDKMFDIIAKSKPSTDMSALIGKMKTFTSKWLPVMGDEAAFSFSYASGKPPFKFHEVVGIQDAAAAKKLMGEGMDMAGDFYAAMGIPMTFQYKPDVATYKNVDINQMVLTFQKSDDPNDQMQKMIEQMYGGNLTYNIATSANALFVNMGDEGENGLKKLIDQQPAAAPTGEVKAAFDALQKTPYTDFICSVNVIKLMAGLGGMMQTMGNIPDGPSMPKDLFSGLDQMPSQSSLAIGGKCADGQTGIRIMLPKQHLMEIMGAVKQIQQKVMSQQQQMNNGDNGQQ